MAHGDGLWVEAILVTQLALRSTKGSLLLSTNAKMPDRSGPELPFL